MLPNFRLSETQARASILFGAAGVVCLAALGVLVFKNLDKDMMVIHYSTASTFGKYRNVLVMAMTALTLGVAVTAALLGFNSLGHKRNQKQGHSWLGLLLGALIIAMAPVLLFAWMQMKQSVLM